MNQHTLVPMTREVWMHTGDEHVQSVNLTRAEKCDRCKGVGWFPRTPTIEEQFCGADFSVAVHCTCQEPWGRWWETCPHLPAKHVVCDECGNAVHQNEKHCPHCGGFVIPF